MYILYFDKYHPDSFSYLMHEFILQQLEKFLDLMAIKSTKMTSKFFIDVGLQTSFCP
jgi:hypothetical protein